MSADVMKPKQELAPTEPNRQRFDWQVLSKWGCLGSALVIVLPALLCAGVAVWLYFSTPTPVDAQERPPVVHKIPNCKQQGKRVHMVLGSNGKVIKAVPRKRIPYVVGRGEIVTNHFSRPFKRWKRCSSWVMAL